MTPIIIGAGRGKRLGHHTDDIPKPLVPIVGRPMLESVLEAFAAGGFERSEVVFICGYKAEVIQRRYPELRYVRNDDWQSNNILLSLMYAREHMAEGFISSYADIVYRPEAITSLLSCPHDIALVTDTAWRRRYDKRSDHPETDAEKLVAEGDRIVRISRRIAPQEATGEFIGVMRATAAGAARLLAAFDEARSHGGVEAELNEGRSIRKAYLIDLLQRMVDNGEALHCVPMDGGYMEIDTLQDAELADSWWQPNKK